MKKKNYNDNELETINVFTSLRIHKKLLQSFSEWYDDFVFLQIMLVYLLTIYYTFMYIYNHTNTYNNLGERKKYKLHWDYS